MGEAKNRKIFKIQNEKYYGNFLLNLLMREKPVIELSPEGVRRNYLRKTIFVPWTEIVTIFDDFISVPMSFSDHNVIGITVTNQYAIDNYQKFFSIKEVIRKEKPSRFSDGLSKTTGNIKIKHDFENEKVILCIYYKQHLKNKGKGLFTSLESNLEISKLGYSYKR
ncbi:hypothetical protein ACQUMI_001861 [Enterococcus faecalis]|uniref:hypothetical protein n=1 Tax=Enterococcus faecalis TaxID=1351 RepID=UPI0019DE7705|nr:hypothetical protein [Enterococcus faecalis]EGO2596446.1 hypothetical protein [Enterococcus faecalis]EGO2806993.1 hypothetical protein [Enterococcus faecalis]EGO6609497.1 hypothetical protein [Enterococcus faecalis]EGO9052193.1 hypothetical protein [Enterococcus faecalis]EGO9793928.1 hypothetical protein [Enterococcus faecalis]